MPRSAPKRSPLKRRAFAWLLCLPANAAMPCISRRRSRRLCCLSIVFMHVPSPQSLSLPGPFGPSSSSSTTTSSPAIIAISAVCNTLLRSVFRGSTRSIGRSFALFRILPTAHQPDAPRPSPRDLQTHRGSHPASTKISTTPLPCSHSSPFSPFTNRTALCSGVSPSRRSCPSISTPSWSRIWSSTS